MLLAPTIGVVIGYMYIGIFSHFMLDWKFSFRSQGAIILIVMVIFLFIPTKYINLDAVLDAKKDMLEQRRYETTGSRMKREPSNDFRNQALHEQVVILGKRIPFVYSVLALSASFYTTSGLQYWMTNYLIVTLKMSEIDANFAFAGSVLTAPVIGAIASGQISMYLGGHQNLSTLRVTLVFLFISSAGAMVFPFMTNTRAALTLLWIMMATGAVYLPMLIGIMLNTVKPEQRAKANSLANFTYNLLGYAPAPTIYGLVMDLTGGKESRWGMVFTFYWGLWAFIFACCVYYLVSKKQGDRDQAQVQINRESELSQL